ncbi:hypothetical protein [Nocardia thailandica]
MSTPDDSTTANSGGARNGERPGASGAAEVAARTKKAVQAGTDTAKQQLSNAKDEAVHAAEVAKEKTDDAQVAARVKASEVADQARRAADQLASSVPDPVAERSKQLALAASRGPVVPLLAAGAVAAVVIWLIIRRRRG